MPYLFVVEINGAIPIVGRDINGIASILLELCLKTIKQIEWN